MDRRESTSLESSSLVASCSFCKDRIENTVSQLVHWCVLGICLEMGIVYRDITLQRVYMLQYGSESHRTRNKNDYAGEDQQQFTRLTYEYCQIKR
jgi:hypothetical protein